MIDPASHVGLVSLTVSDLAGSTKFWERVIGLRVLSSNGGSARLGAGSRELVELVEVPGAVPFPGTTGLFHVALLVPDRVALATWLAGALRTKKVQLTGAADHLVSEAVYLNDPDGHGIEIYRDRPRSEWPSGDDELMATLPLDLRDLLGEAAGSPAPLMPERTVMGHVHLRVADVDATEAFYVDQLGFDLMARCGGQATFMSAGGYHHHLGANVWGSRGGSPAPDGAAALRYATIVLPTEAERTRVAGLAGGDEVCDPSGITLRFVAAP